MRMIAVPLRLLTYGLFFLVLATPASGKEAALLPTLLDSWQQIEWVQADATHLETVAGSEAPLLREYGAQRAEHATYQGGPVQWQVSVYEMVDRSAAYGAFTLLGADGARLPVGEAGSRAGSRTTFYTGNYFAQVEGNVGAADLVPLAQQLRLRAGQQASLPTLPDHLPRRGFVPGSDRYLLGPLSTARVVPLAPGDWIGFAYGAEVEAARYKVADDRGILLLISYPTPAIARARLKEFEQMFYLNEQGNPTHAPAQARRLGSLVAFASGFSDPAHASSLLEDVRYELKVSWSDPSNPRAQQNWAKELLDIFVGTGFFLLFALLSGVAYGLLRVLVKRLAPGKVFDRPGSSEDMIVLDLRNPNP